MVQYEQFYIESKQGNIKHSALGVICYILPWHPSRLSAGNIGRESNEGLISKEVAIRGRDCYTLKTEGGRDDG